MRALMDFLATVWQSVLIVVVVIFGVLFWAVHVVLAVLVLTVLLLIALAQASFLRMKRLWTR